MKEKVGLMEKKREEKTEGRGRRRKSGWMGECIVYTFLFPLSPFFPSLSSAKRKEGRKKTGERLRSKKSGGKA